MALYRGLGGAGTEALLTDVTEQANIAVEAKDAAVAAKNDASDILTQVQATVEDADAVAAIADEITTVAGSITDIQTLADIEDGTDATDAISTVAGISSEVQNVSSISSAVTAVNTNSTNINTVAGISADITTAASLNSTNINTVAGIASDVTTVAGVTTDLANVTANLTDIQNADDNATAAEAALASFNSIYLGEATVAPTTTVVGALYYNSNLDQLYVWDGSQWDEAAFNATGAVTSFNTRTGAVTLSSSDVTTALGYTPVDVAGDTFTGDVSGTNLTLSGYLRGPASFTIDPAAHGDNTGTVVIAGNLQVDGTTTTINSSTMTVDDLNVVVASGAADASAANGAGLTIDGASISLSYDHANTRMSLNSALDVTGTLSENGSAVLKSSDIGSTVQAYDADTAKLDTAQSFTATQTFSGEIAVTSTASINEVIEKCTIDTSTTGTLNFDALTQAVVYLDTDQTADRTVNFRGDVSTTLDSVIATGESMTFAILATQGSTAYYLNTIQIDGTGVTPKWQGGTAPTAGNASGIDSYSFTIIKTGSATFTVLASQTQFA